MCRICCQLTEEHFLIVNLELPFNLCALFNSILILSWEELINLAHSFQTNTHLLQGQINSLKKPSFVKVDAII